MILRSLTARQALAGLLAAVCLPFLAVAKPPDLPGQTKAELRPQVTETPTGLVLASLGVSYTATEDFVGTFCPGFGDTLESCWRTLTSWVPVTCATDCCAEPTTRLAVIEVLPVMPKPVEPRLSDLVIGSFHSGPCEYLIADQSPLMVRQRAYGGIGTCEVLPMPRACEPSEFEFMCLIPEHFERMARADEGCKSCCQQSAPRQIVVSECSDLPCCLLENLAKLEKAHCLVEKAKRCCQDGKLVEACHCYTEAAKLCPGSRYSMQCKAWMHEMMAQCAPGGVIQASATEPVTEAPKRSGGPKIEIRLTIEVKK